MSEILFINKFEYKSGLNEIDVQLPEGYVSVSDKSYTYTDSHIIVAQIFRKLQSENKDPKLMKVFAQGLGH